MKKYKVCIVDDEVYGRENLKALLADDSDVVIECECENGLEAIKAIGYQSFDIVFLDVQMPEVDGFQVINQIKLKQHPIYIFATAHEQYAIRAFEVNAIDYLLKPINEQRFYSALQKAKQRVDNQSMQNVDGILRVIKESQIKSLAVKKGSKTIILSTEEVEFFEANNQYVNIHTKGKKYILRESLTELERKLSTAHFLRVHRSYIINLKMVKSYEPIFKVDYCVELQSGASIKLSRHRKKIFEDQLGLL